MSNHHVGGGIYQINRAIYLLYLKSHRDLLFQHDKFFLFNYT